MTGSIREARKGGNIAGHPCGYRQGQADGAQHKGIQWRHTEEEAPHDRGCGPR